MILIQEIQSIYIFSLALVFLSNGLSLDYQTTNQTIFSGEYFSTTNFEDSTATEVSTEVSQTTYETTFETIEFPKTRPPFVKTNFTSITTPTSLAPHKTNQTTNIIKMSSSSSRQNTQQTSTFKNRNNDIECGPNLSSQKQIIGYFSLDSIKSQLDQINKNCEENLIANYELDEDCKLVGNEPLSDDVEFEICGSNNKKKLDFRDLTFQKFLNMLKAIKNGEDLYFIFNPMQNIPILEYIRISDLANYENFTEIRIEAFEKIYVFNSDQLSEATRTSQIIEISFEKISNNYDLDFDIQYLNKERQKDEKFLSCDCNDNIFTLKAEDLELNNFFSNIIDISLIQDQVKLEDLLGLKQRLLIKITPNPSVIDIDQEKFKEFSTFPVSIKFTDSARSRSKVLTIKSMPESLKNLNYTSNSNEATLNWFNSDSYDFIEFEFNEISYTINKSADSIQYFTFLNLNPASKYSIKIRTGIYGYTELINEQTYNISTKNLYESILILNETLEGNFESLSDNNLLNIYNLVIYVADNLKMSDSSIDSNLIDLLAKVLKRISDRNQSKESPQVVVGYMQCIDSILDINLSKLKLAQQQSNSSSKFSKGIESIFHKINQDSYSNSFKNFYAKTSSSNDLNFESFLNNSNFSTTAFFDNNVISNLISSGSSVRVSFIAYKNSRFFTTNGILNVNDFNCNYGKQISPNIVSVHPLNITASNLIKFQFKEKSPKSCSNAEDIKAKYECVYWDETLNGWNDQGCTYQLIDETENASIHTCVCNHTTSFSLLFSADRFCGWCEDALFYVSIIGTCVSLLGVSITIFYDICITFLPTSKIETYLRSSKSYLMIQQDSMGKQFLKLITTWCVSIFALDSVYIGFTFTNYNGTISQMEESQKSSCIAIGALMHFFLLCSFFFSFSITFVKYLFDSKPFKIFKFIWLKAFAISIVCPILIVSIIVAVDREAYIIDSNNYTPDQLYPNIYCWLKPNYSLYAVIIPIAVILLTNLVLFILIVIINKKMNSNRKKMSSSASNDKEFFKRDLLLILTCFVNTGLTWVFGFLITVPGDTWIYGKFVCALVFCILNSTQGFHIFTVYILVSKRRQQLLKKKIILKMIELKIKIGASLNQN